MPCSKRWPVQTLSKYSKPGLVSPRQGLILMLGVCGIIYAWLTYSKNRCFDLIVNSLIVIGRYCVGTRRQALLNQEQIDRCVRFIESDNITNYEARMVAEVNLYWVIYRNCCGSDIKLPETKIALQNWRQEWTKLFGKSQLLVYS